MLSIITNIPPSVIRAPVKESVATRDFPIPTVETCLAKPVWEMATIVSEKWFFDLLSFFIIVAAHSRQEALGGFFLGGDRAGESRLKNLR